MPIIFAIDHEPQETKTSYKHAYFANDVVDHLGIIYNIRDILQIGRSSLNRENYYAFFVSHSGNCLVNPEPNHYSTLGHDTGRYSTVES